MKSFRWIRITKQRLIIILTRCSLLRAADTVPGRRGIRRGRELQPDAVRPAVAGAVPPLLGAHARGAEGAEQGRRHPDDAVRGLLQPPQHHDPPHQVHPARRLRRRRRRHRDRALQSLRGARPPRARQGLRRRGQRQARRRRRGRQGAAAALAPRRRQGRRRGQPERDERGDVHRGWPAGGGPRRLWQQAGGCAVAGPRAGGVCAQGEQARARVLQHRDRRGG